MTEPLPEAPAATPEEKPAGRGRPRPQSTIDRDEAAFAQLEAAGAEGLTRDELAEKLGKKSSEAYLSLYRLNKAGRAAKLDGNSRKWAVISAPVSEPVGAPTA